MKLVIASGIGRDGDAFLNIKVIQGIEGEIDKIIKNFWLKGERSLCEKRKEE